MVLGGFVTESQLIGRAQSGVLRRLPKCGTPFINRSYSIFSRCSLTYSRLFCLRDWCSAETFHCSRVPKLIPRPQQRRSCLRLCFPSSIHGNEGRRSSLDGKICKRRARSRQNRHPRECGDPGLTIQNHKCSDLLKRCLDPRVKPVDDEGVIMRPPSATCRLGDSLLAKDRKGRACAGACQ